MRDHPRSRGVYRGVYRYDYRMVGSSPLARGLRSAAAAVAFALRIIPARAGFTPAASRRGTQRGDHPRSRGVYAVLDPSGAHLLGSSPLARGLPTPEGEKVTQIRIIPARAGFTLRRRLCSSLSWDHPRSRGVYPGIRSGRTRWPGSSPLARGLPDRLNGAHHIRGIIPARAGFTETQRRRRARVPDHPRSRGVYAAGIIRPPSREGSSPLARGLPISGPWPMGGRRIIPARAGFTHGRDDGR